MPREVVKLVGGRAYRYRVESYRDAASGKARVRWTYLGKVDAADAAATIPPASIRRPDATRKRLVGALARLLERHSYAEVTASAVATEAGCAHGTFYRHFPDKRAALAALFEEVGAGVARERPSFEGALGTRESERARVAAWAASTLRTSIERPGLVRAWQARCAQEPELARVRAGLRAAAVSSLASYLARLVAAGYSSVEAPDALARAINVALDGIRFRAAFDRADFDETDAGAVLALIDRAIFTGAPRETPLSTSSG